jgi:Asp-tRNA(Asn)/Glu-tRNA(Gln) amidotransferase A subunit family amidase
VRDLIYMPARRQLQLFKRRALSPVEVLKAQIEQIEKFGARINAVTYEHFEQAMRAARTSASRYRNGSNRPLDGITVAVKDEFDRAGWRTTLGSRVTDHRAKKQNHPQIDKLLAAGAVLHIQTTAPEFHLLPLTWSKRWGVTRNPWNLAVTPGGSSGGSAAVTAAGMTTLAIGSDMGGSLRIPAALNGLYGFNPPYGRNTAAAEDALLVHASSGPLARNLDDMILLQNVMTGPADGAVAIAPALELPRRFPSIKGWKIALSMDQGWARVERDVRGNIQTAAQILQDAGAIVEEIDLDIGLNARALRDAIEQALFSTAVGGELAERPARGLTSYGLRFRKLASRMASRHAMQAGEAAVEVHSALEKAVFSKGFRLLICPTICTTAVAADYDPTRDRLVVDGKPVDPYVGWFQTSIFNLLNWMPVINVPAGRGRNGVPAGLQIAAQPYDDLAAFAAASAYTQRSPALFGPDVLPALR